MAPLLPSGISAARISGLVGVTCTALPAGAHPNEWSVPAARFMNELKLNFSLFFWLAMTNPSAARTIPMVSAGRLCDRIFFSSNYPSLFFWQR